MSTTDAQQLRGQWNSVRHLVKERWAHLTDEDFRALEQDLQQFVSRVQQRTGEAREAIEAYLAGLTAHATASASEYARQAGDRVRAGFDSAEELVRDRPGQSLVAALGCGLAAGLVLGLMIRRR